MMIMPIIFVTIAVLAVHSLRTQHDLPSLKLDLNDYGKTITLVESNVSQSESFTDIYKDLVASKWNEIKEVETGIENFILDVVSFYVAIS